MEGEEKTEGVVQEASNPQDVQQQNAPKKEHKWSDKFVENHDLILDMLRGGKTMRVIHTIIKCDRHVLSNYIKDTPDLKQAYEDALEDKLDLNEEIVLDIASKDPTTQIGEAGAFSQFDGRVMTASLNAAKFFLERMGHKRGWGAKLETNEVGKGGGRVPVIYVRNVSEEEIAEADAEVEEANREAQKGLEGITHG